MTNQNARYRVAFAPNADKVMATADEHLFWVFNRMKNPRWVFAPNKAAAINAYNRPKLY